MSDLDNLFSADPVALFQSWMKEAEAAKLTEPNAMTLSTIGDDGFPHARIVYLKGMEKDGFEFYTNYKSHKGLELLKNPNASLLFFWPGLGGSLGKQVRIEGTVHKLTAAQSDAYFATRARGSQIGAWASEQSHPLKSRTDLETRVQDLEKKYAGQPVPRPPHWGGYGLTPVRFEFWIGRDSRLHDRCVYEKRSGAATWSRTRLFP